MSSGKSMLNLSGPKKKLTSKIERNTEGLTHESWLEISKSSVYYYLKKKVVQESCMELIERWQC